MLLIETIKTVADKLFINWINVRPIPPSQIQNKIIYKNTQNAILNNKLSIDDLEILDISNIYNVISYDLYHNIKRLKWLIYTLNNRYVIEHLNELFDLKPILNDQLWTYLTETDKNIFIQSLKELTKSNNLNLAKIVGKFYDANFIKSQKKLDNVKIISDENIKEYFKSIYPQNIYEYFRESINLLKQTWYSHYLINDNMIFPKEIISKSIRIKNIYNFAKALVKFPELPKDWRSLTIEQKNFIVNRLNTKGWFNISKSLAKSSQGTLTSDQIFDIIKSNITMIIFDVLSRKGVLTEFVSDFDLTDLKLEKNRINRLKNVMMENRSDYIDAYYHVTNTSFNKIFVNDMKGNNRLYIDLISEEKDIYSWLWNYSVDWISQIAMYHKYLNNRVIYITGSTGVGKSTTGPRLLLYCLKMIDYKTDGVMVVTVPRISVASSVAPFIAKQSGVNIFNYNRSINGDVRTNNYYVQYDFQGDSVHTKKVTHPYLLFVTDGLLNNQLKNPILKRTIPGNDTLYSNMYDIVMVDEAHEHNVNMDIILTKMRYAVYYNDTIKLVITSATMDQDEPIYRRYYRSINDNQISPFNMWIKEQSIDRINVDRRIHISPPGQTTKYLINDIYKPNTNPIDIIVDLINKSLDGNVLLFEPGRKDILMAVDEINKRTMNVNNVIAIPLYGEMLEDKRNLITTKNMAQRLTNPKDIRYDIYDPQKDKSVIPGTYKYAIIVATPIAEASLTFEDLKYVIDTGTQKINKYSYKTRNDMLETIYIAESNRLQRRGRVGRTSSGTVFYAYEKNLLINNKPNYNISISNLTDIVYQLLADDPNEQYFTSKYSFIFFDYIGNPEHNNYNINKEPPQYLLTGYAKNTIDDNDGIFYIIHPNEPSLKRNITGKIIGFNKTDDLIVSDNKIIKNLKIESFWKANIDRQFIDNNFKKTAIGKELFFIMIDTKLSYQDIIAYLYSIKLECKDEMLLVLALIPEMKMGVSKLSKILPKNNRGDIYTALQVSYDLMSFIKRYENNIKINDPYQNAKKIFIQNILTQNFTGIDQMTLDKLIIQYNNNKLNTEYNEQPVRVEIDMGRLRKYCLFRGYNFDIVLNFIARIRQLQKLFNSDKTKELIHNILDKIDIDYYPSSVYEKIIKSLEKAYYYNMYYYHGNNQYTNINNKEITLSVITDYKNKPDTTLDTRYTSFYVMAIYNTDDEISVLSRFKNVNMII